MSSIFQVPEWEATDKTVDYDFNMKAPKIKKKKSSKPRDEEPARPNYVTLKRPETTKDKSLAVPMKAKDQQQKQKKVGKMALDKLKDSLKASRFRYINEQLYTSSSSDAVKMFKEDPDAFTVYHDGYRSQVQNWPANPLHRIIKAIRKLPKDHVIVDFGCGDAKLAQSVSNKVHSLDLIASNSDVIACDMAHTNLKTKSANVAVFCLSLMGVNLRDFLAEANRVLKPNGLLMIAEVKSRFEKVDDFVNNVQSCGFKMSNKDVKGEYFYFFNFKKTEDSPKKGAAFSLKPCLYKKR